MKLNFNFHIKGLDGSELTGPNGNAGKILGNALASGNRGNSIKLHDWALKVWNGQPLEIDDTDADVLSELVNTTDMLTVLAKAPIMEYIKTVKEKKK